MNETDEVQTRNRQLYLAYARVFGAPGKRTPAQEMVMADLEMRCGMHKPIFRPDSTGAVCPIRGYLTEGRRTSILEIQDFVRRGSAVEPKPKPKVRKKP